MKYRWRLCGVGYWHDRRIRRTLLLAAALLLISLLTFLASFASIRLLPQHVSPPLPSQPQQAHKPSDVDRAARVTIVITGHESGFRPSWLRATIERYLSSEFDTLVDRVILVWNNPDVSCPVHITDPRLVVLPQSANSLNNRWIHTLPYIHTAAVFNLDDDVFVARTGLRCMIEWWRNDSLRLVSPYVRLIHSNNTYVMDDLRLGGRYSIALPRAVLLSRDHLVTYAANDPQLLRYVDEQEARCDDILLNAAVGSSTGRAPLRVLLPAESVVDHFANCDFGGMEGVGGLTLQANRSALRSECTLGIAERHFDRGSGLHHSSDAVATCTAEGRRAALRHTVLEGEFANMLNNAPCE